MYRENNKGPSILCYCVLCVLYYICNEAQQNLRAIVSARKIGLRPHYFFTDRSKAVLLLWFILSVNVRSLSVGL